MRGIGGRTKLPRLLDVYRALGAVGLTVARRGGWCTGTPAAQQGGRGEGRPRHGPARPVHAPHGCLLPAAKFDRSHPTHRRDLALDWS